MICVKCGNRIESSECTLLTCSNDIHQRLKKCECKTCDCFHRTIFNNCQSCLKGIHKGKI